MKKIIISVFLVLVVAIGATGIIKSVTMANKDVPAIDVILKCNSSEYWSLVKSGAEACAQDYGVRIDVKGPATEEDILDQVNLLKSDIESDVYDAYVVAPGSNLINEVVDGTNAKFVAMDTEIDSDKVVSFVGTDNYNAAKEVANKAVNLAKKRGVQVIDSVCISGVLEDKASDDRKLGFRDGTIGAAGKMYDEVYYTNGKGDSAANAMINVMKNHKDGVAIVYCNNDEMAIEAAKTARTNEAYKDTVFVGFDGIHSGCIAIKDNQIELSVGQDAYEIGYKSVEAAILAVNGNEAEKIINTGYKLIDEENADKRIEELIGLK